MPFNIVPRFPIREGGAISVVIPVWREGEGLADLLALCQAAPEVWEVIVAVADGSAPLAQQVRELGAACVSVEAPSRGRQLDAGAAAASGKWVLFHHADSRLTEGHLRALANLDPDAVGGAFYRKFDERHPALRGFEGIERWHNRTFGALYGDQSLFARRDVFAAIGGFRGLPLMEDVDFSRRLRRAGKVVILDPPMASSPRRHLARGPWRTTLTNAALLALFHLGVSPHCLHAWYYRPGAGAPSDLDAPLEGAAFHPPATLVP